MSQVFLHYKLSTTAFIHMVAFVALMSCKVGTLRLGNSSSQDFLMNFLNASLRDFEAFASNSSFFFLLDLYSDLETLYPVNSTFTFSCLNCFELTLLWSYCTKSLVSEVIRVWRSRWDFNLNILTLKRPLYTSPFTILGWNAHISCALAATS